MPADKPEGKPPSRFTPSTSHRLTEATKDDLDWCAERERLAGATGAIAWLAAKYARENPPPKGWVPKRKRKGGG